jgi:hypothetical protein
MPSCSQISCLVPLDAVLQVTPTLALYDTMQYVRSPTATVCYGMCLGMGGFLLTAGGEKVSRGVAARPCPPPFLDASACLFAGLALHGISSWRTFLVTIHN